MNRRGFITSATSLVLSGTVEPLAPVPPPVVVPDEDCDGPPDDSDPHARAVAEATWPLLDACRALLNEHSEWEPAGPCFCDFCIEARALRHYVEVSESFVSGSLVHWPAYDLRLAAEAKRRRRDTAEAEFWEASATGNLKGQAQAAGKLVAQFEKKSGSAARGGR